MKRTLLIYARLDHFQCQLLTEKKKKKDRIGILVNAGEKNK